jgi:hypothetical protein
MSRQAKEVQGQVGFNFQRGGLNIPEVSGSFAVYGINGELIVPEFPGSRVDLETGEIIPLQENEKLYPLPVDAIWVDPVKKYQLSEANYSFLKRRLTMLKKDEYFSKGVEKLLNLSSEELLSRLVVIKSGSPLYEFFDGTDDTVKLCGNIIALPKKHFNAEWRENEQQFIYVARAGIKIRRNKSGAYSMSPAKYDYDGQMQNMKMGAIFKIGVGRAFLLKTELSTKSGQVAY